MDSVKKNGICLKGVVNAPDMNFEVSFSIFFPKINLILNFFFQGELMAINQQFRRNLDLYANVVKVKCGKCGPIKMWQMWSH